MSHFSVVDVNGLNGSLTYGMVKNGGGLLGRTGHLDLGRSIIRANSHLWGDDWVDGIEPHKVHAWNKWWMSRDKADVVVAVPPCSGFSGLTGKGAARGWGGSQTASPTHPANHCMWSSAQYAARHQPEIYLFESVTGAYTKGREIMQGLRAIMEWVAKEPYVLTHWLHDGAVVGAPSSRQRYLFVVTKGDRPWAVTPVGSYAVETITPLRDAISDLEALPLAYGDQQLGAPDSDYQKRRRRDDGLVDGHHLQIRPRGGEEKHAIMRRGMFAACAEMGVPWIESEKESDVLQRIQARFGNERIIEILGEKRGTRLIGNNFKMGPFQVGREAWDAMNLLITGGGPSQHLHPHLDRGMTYREGARIQGWPDELKIDYDVTKYGKEHIDSVWGKSVMPSVSEHVGHEVKLWLDHDSGQTDFGTLIGEREFLIDHMAESRRLRAQSRQIRSTALMRGNLAVESALTAAAGQGQGQGQ